MHQANNWLGQLSFCKKFLTRKVVGTTHIFWVRINFSCGIYFVSMDVEIIVSHIMCTLMELFLCKSTSCRYHICLYSKIDKKNLLTLQISWQTYYVDSSWFFSSVNKFFVIRENAYLVNKIVDITRTPYGMVQAAELHFLFVVTLDSLHNWQWTFDVFDMPFPIIQHKEAMYN